MAPVYDSGDTAWMIVSTALVLLMVPGLAIFNAGMVRAKHALGMIMFAFAAVVAVSVTWVLLGFTLAFGPDAGAGLVGTFRYAGLAGIDVAAAQAHATVPPIAFVMFQMAVAIVAAVVITGAAADRMKFGAMLTFLTIWSVAVYPIVAHWTWSPEGWLASWGVLDYGGGAAIGLAAGASALALAMVLGPRRGWRQQSMQPHSVPLTMLGAGLLWVGWIGLSGGSAVAANATAASAALGTHLAGVGGIAGWLLLEKRIFGKPTALGVASGAVAAFMAATPAAGYLDPFASLLLGFIAGAVAFLGVRLKFRLKIDDSLDVLAVHYMGSAVGVLFIGIFARLIVGDGTTSGVGLLNGGDASQLGKQAVALLAVSGFAFLASAIIAMVLRAVMGLRVTPEAEEQGLDTDQHGQSAYGIRH